MFINHPVMCQKIGLRRCCSDICELCNICNHVYRCDCRDNSVTMAICEHIHAIHLKLQTKKEIDGEIVISGLRISGEKEILLASSQASKRIFEHLVHEWLR